MNPKKNNKKMKGNVDFKFNKETGSYHISGAYEGYLAFVFITPKDAKFEVEEMLDVLATFDTFKDAKKFAGQRVKEIIKLKKLKQHKIVGIGNIF